MELDPNCRALYANEVFHDLAMNLSRILFPVLLHCCLRLSNGINYAVTSTTGFSLVFTSGPVVNPGTCWSMTTVLALLSLLAAVTAHYPGVTCAWHNDPSTLAGNMGSLSDRWNREFFSKSRETARWGKVQFIPFVLRVKVRISMVFYLLAITTGLLYTRYFSNSHFGLGTLLDEGYIHLTWTLIPALAMLSVSLYVNSCDTSYRSLATFSTLSSRPYGVEELDGYL
ncbi:hypothetical protein C8035_v011006 [Colletotrichum spinosum]|uniref:Uncharacterized protein n=1 Tax=Colletotrichum spinosum TaxID=1347390 RepID=A0A4R8QA39_9PEZI|nr:hypothetical protein C8035_v011006 [Colletotrichum spinosum]